MANYAVHVCDFSNGWFSIRSKSGKQGLDFEDSDRFGPMLINMRTGDLDFVPEKSWFWSFYQSWRDAGRPTEGAPRTTPFGPIQTAIWVSHEDGSQAPPASDGEGSVAKGEAIPTELNPPPTTQGNGEP